MKGDHKMGCFWLLDCKSEKRSLNETMVFQLHRSENAGSTVSTM